MSAKDMGKPLEYSNGKEVVKIYESSARGQKVYQISYYQAGQRKRKSFSNLSEAKREAKLLLGSLACHSAEMDSWSSTDMQSALLAKKHLGDLDISLHVVTEQFTSAMKLLPEGITLRDVCEFYRKHHPSDMERIPLSEMVERFLESRQRLGLTKLYVADCGITLNGLQKVYSGDSLPTSKNVMDWLEKAYTNPITRNSKLRTLKVFCAWAVKQKLAPINTLVDVEYWKEPPNAISIYTPEEIAEFLRVVPKLIKPFVAIGAFAGLRTAEIDRLDWKEVNLERGFITVAAEKAKTAARRLVPIQENLKSWLKPFAKKEGKVVPYEKSYVAQCIKQTGFKIKRNALRHSYISYRLAQIHDTARIALECGNSPDMIFRHYRELVSPEDSEKWFSIKPI